MVLLLKGGLAFWCRSGWNLNRRPMKGCQVECVVLKPSVTTLCSSRLFCLSSPKQVPSTLPVQHRSPQQCCCAQAQGWARGLQLELPVYPLTTLYSSFIIYQRVLHAQGRHWHTSHHTTLPGSACQAAGMARLLLHIQTEKCLLPSVRLVLV